jgi:hypothetical protein
MADSKISALTAMAAWAAGDLIETVDVSDTTMGAGGTNKKSTLQQLMTFFTGSTSVVGATETTSKPLLNLTQTWNAIGVTFDAVDVNITSNNSAAASRLLRLRVGGTEQFSVRKDGAIFGPGASGPLIHASSNLWRFCNSDASFPTIDMSTGGTGIVVSNASRFIWKDNTYTNAGSNDTGLGRNAAGVVEVNNGTNGIYRDLRARNLRVEPTAFASLVAAGTAGQGALAWVTDATATTARSTVAGGGSNKVLVMSDGTNWLIVA